MNNVENHPHEKKMTTRLLHSNNHHFFLTPFPYLLVEHYTGIPPGTFYWNAVKNLALARRIDVVALLAQQRGWRPLQQQDLGCAGYLYEWMLSHGLNGNRDGARFNNGCLDRHLV